MVSGESPDWLPPGFTVKIKNTKGRKDKYYFNVATGKKYYSKNEVIRCAAEYNSLQVTPQTKNADDKPSSNVNVYSISDKTKDSAAWLPSGWAVEERKRMSGLTQGIPYKVYTELSTGSEFYSKEAVTRYLNTIAHADTTTKQNIIDNEDELLPDKSLQVLPMTNTSRTDEKERKGNSLVKIDNVGEPIPDMSPLVKSATNTDGIVGKKRKGRSFAPIKQVAVERTIADGLPSGWIKEIRTSQSGKKTRKDPFYIDPVSGYMFHSKPDALRYLKTNNISSCAIRPRKKEDGIKSLQNKNSIDNEDEPLPEKSLQVLPTANTGRTDEKERKGNSVVKIDNVDEPFPEKLLQIISTRNTDDAHDGRRKGNTLVKIDSVGEPLPDMSPLVKSATNTDGIVGKKRKGRSFAPVAVERTIADGLPSGWIKEIRTSQSGKKTRKDPFYIDPVSGYMFRSKPDALRYLKTNDISSCAIRPQKREDGIKSLENKNSSNPATPNLSMQKRELFLSEESNGGGESSGTKIPPDTDTKTLKPKIVSPESDVSKKESRAVAVDVAMSSTPITGGGGISNLGSRKSKKRTNSSLTLRASKRLAGSEPEIQSDLDLNERSLRTTVRGSAVSKVDTSPSYPLEASDFPQTSNIEPPKEPTDHTVRNEETLQDVNQLKEVEEPPTEGSPIPRETSVAKESQNSKLFDDFGESWSHPMEFALKTLTDEIQIDDTSTFSSFFGDGSLEQPEFAAPVNFQSESASNSEPLKKENVVDPSPTTSSPSFSPLANVRFNSGVGVNFQPSTEVARKDSQSQTKFHS